MVAGAMIDGDLVYRPVPVTPFDMIVVVPEIDGDPVPPMPERIATEDALHDHNRLPLLIDALGNGDVGLLARVIDDRLHSPRVRQRSPGYAHVAEVARLAGARAMTTSGEGPALVIFADDHHQRIAEAVETAFDNLDIPARTWVLPFDTQGIVISAMQSA